MKRILIASLVLFSIKANSQLRVELVLGHTDQMVRSYFDSLFLLKGNPAYKIQEGVTDAGNLTLTADFSTDDTKFYNCGMVTTTFTRIGGVETCTSQMISGPIEVATVNLNYIKDNFQKVPGSSATWELQYPSRPGYLTVATFHKMGNDYFALIIEVKKN